MAGLEWNQFKKRYKNNLEIVFTKFKNKEPLDLIKKDTTLPGNGLKFIFNTLIIRQKSKDNVLKLSSFPTKEDFSKRIMDVYPENLSGISLYFSDGRKKISSNNILKTAEFGGKNPTGKKAIIHWGYLGILQQTMDRSYKLNSPTATESGELLFINDFNSTLEREIEKEIKNPRSTIDKLCPGLTIKIGSFIFDGVVGVNKVSGTPKADLALVACKNKKLVEVAYISHKKGSSAKDFQQYGGLSKDAGDIIFNDTLVKEYIRALKENVGETASSGQSFYRVISSDLSGKNLVGRSVYGPEWSSGNRSYNENSIHCIFQGDPTLQKQGNIYNLHASGALHTSKDITWAFNGNFKAVFASTFRAGRSTVSSEGIKINFLRTGIYPIDFILSRKAKEI